MTSLFPDGSDPVGKIIRFSKIPLRVVGVLKAKGYNSMGQDQDAVVLAPYTTVINVCLPLRICRECLPLPLPKI